MDLVTLALAKKYTNQKVNNILSFGGFEIVESLPTSDISHSTVYLLKSSEEARNIYTEYIYTKNNEWESLGTTVDLNGYITEENLQEAIDTALAQARDSGEFKPVKGEDYWTEDDKQEIIDEVVAEMPEGGAEGLVYKQAGGSLPSELDDFSITKVFKFNNAYYALLGQSKNDFINGNDYPRDDVGDYARLTDQYLYSVDGINWEVRSFGKEGNWIDYSIIDNTLYVLDGSYHLHWWEQEEDFETGEWIDIEKNFYSTTNTLLATQTGTNWTRITLPEYGRYTCINETYIGGLLGELVQIIPSSDTNQSLTVDFKQFNLEREYPILDLVFCIASCTFESDRFNQAQVIYFYTKEQKLYGYDIADAYSDDREPVLFECGELPIQDIYRLEKVRGDWTSYDTLVLLGEAGCATCPLTTNDGLDGTTERYRYREIEYYNWTMLESFSTPYYWNGVITWDNDWYTPRYYYQTNASLYNCVYIIDTENDYNISLGSLWSDNYDGEWHFNTYLGRGEEYYLIEWLDSLRFILQDNEDKSAGVSETLWPHLSSKVNTLIPTIHPNTLQGATQVVEPPHYEDFRICHNKKLNRSAWGNNVSSYGASSDIYFSDNEGLSWQQAENNPDSFILGAGASVFILDGSERTYETIDYEDVVRIIKPRFFATTFEPDSATIECQFNEELPVQNYNFICGEVDSKDRLILYGTNIIAYSEDGISWLVVKDSFPFTDQATILYCQDRFVALENNQLASSTDGVTWEIIATLNWDTVGRMLWALGKLFIFGFKSDSGVRQGTISISQDQGLTWTDTYSDDFRVPDLFAFGRFYFAANATGTYESFDGIHWEKSSAPSYNNDPTCDYQRFFTISEQSLIYGVGYAGYPFFYQTTDGQHWIRVYYAIANYEAENITKAVSTAISQQLYHNYTVSVGSNEWNSEKQWICALGAGRVNNNSLVLVAAHPRTRKPYAAANVQCIDQGEGTLTFECATIPSDTILINLTIFGQHEITIPYLSEEV